MSTPATQALRDAGTPPAPSAAPVPSAAPTPAPGTVPAPTGFWSTWDKPEQKDTRDWVANKNYADPFTLAKSARDWETQASTLRAGKGYPVAGQDGKVDPNADKAWRTLTGVPELAEKYELPDIPNNPYPQWKGLMQEMMLETGVPAAMAPRLAAGYEAALGKMEAALKADEDAKSTAALEQLKVSWGPQYQERMALGNRGQSWLAEQAGGLDEIQMRTLEKIMGTEKFLNMTWKLGAANAEGRFAGGNDAAPFKGGATEAQTRLNQLTADRNSNKISDAEWREIVKKGGEFDRLEAAIVAGMAPQN